MFGVRIVTMRRVACRAITLVFAKLFVCNKLNTMHTYTARQYGITQCAGERNTSKNNVTSVFSRSNAPTNLIKETYISISPRHLLVLRASNAAKPKRRREQRRTDDERGTNVMQHDPKINPYPNVHVRHVRLDNVIVLCQQKHIACKRRRRRRCQRVNNRTSKQARSANFSLAQQASRSPAACRRRRCTACARRRARQRIFFSFLAARAHSPRQPARSASRANKTRATAQQKATRTREGSAASNHCKRDAAPTACANKRVDVKIRSNDHNIVVAVVCLRVACCVFVFVFVFVCVFGWLVLRRNNAPAVCSSLA